MSLATNASEPQDVANVGEGQVEGTWSSVHLRIAEREGSRSGAIASPFLAVLFLSSSSVAQTRPVVALFEIEARINLNERFVEDLNDYLASQLVMSGYQLIPREEIHQRLSQWSKAPCRETQCQILLGKELAAEKIVGARIAKMADRCITTVSVYDLQKATREGAATAKSGCEEAALIEAIESVAEKLRGQLRSSARQPDPARWEILGGTWRVEQDALQGSGGAIRFLQEVRDFSLSVDIEHRAGRKWAVHVGWRMNLIAGGKKRFRNGSSDLQGYAFHFTFDGLYQLYRGLGGIWQPLLDEVAFRRSERLTQNKVQLRIVVRGDRFQVFTKEGLLLAQAQDDLHAVGSITLFVQDATEVVRFSNLSIEPR